MGITFKQGAMIRHLVISLIVLTAVVESRPQSSAHVKFSSPLQTYSHGVELPGTGRADTLSVGGVHQTYSHGVELPGTGRADTLSVGGVHQTYSHGVELPGTGRSIGGVHQTYSRGVDLPGRYSGYSSGLVTGRPREYLLERRSRFIEPSSLYYNRQSLEQTAPSSPEEMYPNGVFLPPDNEELQYLDAATSEDDPLLITGEEAKIAVANLFSRGSLYYDQIPHVRALRRHEEERRRNGLSIHLLSSNRPESPFYRGGAASNRRRSSFLSY